MMQLPHRLIWGQLCWHKLKIGAQRCIHGTTVSIPPIATGAPSQPPVPPRETKEVKEIQIPVPWGHISGKWWGRTDVQPVLMLHGWQDNAGTFDTLAPLLDIESLLAYDLVGHGRSSHYPLGQCYSYVDGLLCLRLVVKYLGLGEKGRVSLIGHSFGGFTAFEYAGAFPDSVDRLVCVECPRGALKAVKLQYPVVGDIQRAIDTTLASEKWAKELASAPGYTIDEIVQAYARGSGGSATGARARAIVSRGVVASQVAKDRFTFSVDPRVRACTWGGMTDDTIYTIASHFTCRVLHVRATRSFTARPDSLPLYERSLAIVGLHARHHESHVVDGTHHVHLNSPELVAPLINDFFNMHDYGVVY